MRGTESGAVAGVIEEKGERPPAMVGKLREPSFFTAAETAEIFRLDESTLYRHLRNGSFPGIKIGGRYVVPAAVIQQLVDDVLATGRCLDLSTWTREWRQQQAAALVNSAAQDVRLAGIEVAR